MTRKAVASNCPRCRQPVLAGDDADKAAFSAVVDPWPLTRAGELLAVVDGRRTYELAQGALHRRDRWSIRSERPSVVAGHRCDEPIPHSWCRPTPKPTPRPEVDF